MLLKDDYALTTHEDENGAEWDIRISFDYQPFEAAEYGKDGNCEYPGCESSVSITGTERLEPADIDVFEWMEWNNESDSQCKDWEAEIYEAINQEFIDNRGEE